MTNPYLRPSTSLPIRLDLQRSRISFLTGILVGLLSSWLVHPIAAVLVGIIAAVTTYHVLGRKI